MKPRCAHDFRQRDNVFVAIVLLCLISHIKHRKSAVCCCRESNRCSEASGALLLFVAGTCLLLAEAVECARLRAFSIGLSLPVSLPSPDLIRGLAGQSSIHWSVVARSPGQSRIKSGRTMAAQR